MTFTTRLLLRSTANKIGTERPSNRTDIAYLFYLPFSSIFVSSDNLHRKTAPLFMRPDQQFVWGHDLKPALKAINDHFLTTMSEAEKEKGLMSVADNPPPGNLVAEIWDARMRHGYRDEPSVKMDPEEEKKLVERLTAFRKQPTIELDEGNTLDDDMISIARSVRRRRGSWYQVPKDLPDPKDDD